MVGVNDPSCLDHTEQSTSVTEIVACCIDIGNIHRQYVIKIVMTYTAMCVYCHVIDTAMCNACSP